jgi:hypothetical protein
VYATYATAASTARRPSVERLLTSTQRDGKAQGGAERRFEGVRLFGKRSNKMRHLNPRTDPNGFSASVSTVSVRRATVINRVQCPQAWFFRRWICWSPPPRRSSCRRGRQERPGDCCRSNSRAMRFIGNPPRIS